MNQYFISGIDTDCGKTIVTGIISKYLLQQNKTVITQKPIQTGCEIFSEDIATHRKIETRDLLNVDKSGLTCRYLFSHPASPHLAAAIEQKTIDPELFYNDSIQLKKDFEYVLTEGAGGLFVPLTNNYLTIDFIKDKNLPLILVGSSKLGSINHSLLSIYSCYHKKIELKLFVYNHFPANDKHILNDSVKIISNFLKVHYPKCQLIEIPVIDINNIDKFNFAIDL